MCRASAILLLCLATLARADDFGAITSSVNAHNRLTACAQMIAWVDAHRTDPRAPQGLIWAGRLELIASRRDEAEALFRRVEQDYPGTEWALQAKKGLADVALLEHRFTAALEGYRALAARPEPFWRYTGKMAVISARGEEARFAAMIAIVLGLLGFWGVVFARAGMRRLWPWPEELVYALPVLVLLVFASFAQPRPERGALLTVALGGAALLWLNGAWMRARPPERAGRIVLALFGLAQATALLFCAFAANGLWDKLMDTITMGVDR